MTKNHTGEEGEAHLKFLFGTFIQKTVEVGPLKM